MKSVVVCGSKRYAKEMGYAAALGKPIFALSAAIGDPCRDALIDKVVKTPKTLAALL